MLFFYFFAYGRKFGVMDKNAMKNTIKSLLSVAFYFLVSVAGRSLYSLSDSEINSIRINFAVSFLTQRLA